MPWRHVFVHVAHGPAWHGFVTGLHPQPTFDPSLPPELTWLVPSQNESATCWRVARLIWPLTTSKDVHVAERVCVPLVPHCVAEHPESSEISQR